MLPYGTTKNFNPSLNSFNPRLQCWLCNQFTILVICSYTNNNDNPWCNVQRAKIFSINQEDRCALDDDNSEIHDMHFQTSFVWLSQTHSSITKKEEILIIKCSMKLETLNWKWESSWELFEAFFHLAAYFTIKRDENSTM